MDFFSSKQFLTLLLLLSNLALASHFRFSISEINPILTRDMQEDDLFLAIAATSPGSPTLNTTFPLGSVEKNQTIKWDNLTQEIIIPDTANNSNLTIAIGILNQQDGDEEKVFKFAQGITSVATAFPGPPGIIAGILSFVVDFIGGLFNCDGPVVVDKIVYAPDALNALDQNGTICDFKNYTLENENPVCGSNPNYTVAYCLERLDAKPKPGGGANGAGVLAPGWGVGVAGLAVAMGCMVFL